MMLIIISKEDWVRNEATLINELFDSGMTIFHFRKPSYSKQEYEEILSAITPKYLSKIAIHQHHDLAEYYGINRLHIPSKVRFASPPDLLNEVTKQGKLFTTSVHSVKEYYSLQGDFEYTFYGPVFNSISKPGYLANHRREIQPGLAKTVIRIIAIGGINVHNLNEVFNMGFDGAAVLGAIWNSPGEEVNKFIELKNICKAVAQ